MTWFALYCCHLLKAVFASSSAPHVSTGDTNLLWMFFLKRVNQFLFQSRTTAHCSAVSDSCWATFLTFLSCTVDSTSAFCFPINKWVFLWIASLSLAHPRSAVEVAVISFFRGKQIRLRSAMTMTLFYFRGSGMNSKLSLGLLLIPNTCKC